MRAASSASSNARDCALERYRIAQSLRRPPLSVQSRIRLMTKSASSRSLNAAYSRTGSPGSPLVHRFLPSRPLLLRDQRIRRRQDVAGGTIVLLQPEQLHVGEIAPVLLQVLDLRAAPAIDRLIVIADRERQALRAHQQLQPVVLNGVGVLELVDQHMPEARPIMREHVGPVAQQFVSAQQQFGEIDDCRRGRTVPDRPRRA